MHGATPASLTGEGATDELPGDTAADAGGDDTAEDTATGPDGSVQTAPARVVLDCPGAIPDATSIPCGITVTSPDTTNVVTGNAQLSLRGRSSSDFPKKQYKVAFVDDAGQSAPVDLLGMGRESDWVLNGMWIDRAMVRNKLAWDLFNALAKKPDHAPESRYAELTINGEYEGVYLLNQTIDHDGSRLDFDDDDGTGARFIVAADETGLPSRIQYASWKIEYPPESKQTAQVRAGVSAALGAWEKEVVASRKPFGQMDQDSFVLFVLIEEFMKNNDGYFLSHRVWRGDDGMLRMVPWDLDLTLGQPYYNDNSLPDTWISYRPTLVTGSDSTAFRTALAARWAAARADVLATDAVIARIEAQRAVMGPAIDRNWTRWDITSVDFGGTLYPVTSADQEYDLVEAWVRARLAWMDENVSSF